MIHFLDYHQASLKRLTVESKNSFLLIWFHSSSNSML